jgi:predicted ABC-type transport system involved in lysophospholipase L1 biosynthesis ATPase subunit
VLLAGEPGGYLDEALATRSSPWEKLSAARGPAIVLVTGESAIARRSPRVALMGQVRLDRS